ncbi:MAG: hypothetical protein AAF682_13415 [Planctomycetota bacterium]
MPTCLHLATIATAATIALPALGAAQSDAVTTHWDALLEDVVVGAIDQTPLAEGQELKGFHDPDEPHNAGDCYYIYPRNLAQDSFVLPNTDAYVGMQFSTKSVSNATRDAFLDEIFDRTGVHGRVLAQPEGLVGGGASPDLQILVNQIVKLPGDPADPGCLASLILPPGWDPSGDYPIVVSMEYDVNSSLFEGPFRYAADGGQFATMVALSAPLGGAIAVMWNGGGTLGSYSFNPKAFYQFHAVLQLAQQYGGNKQKVLTIGNSRGGSGALSVVANPFELPYRIVSSAASSASVKFSTWEEGVGPYPSVTFPKALHNISRTVGFWDSWRPGWAYPASDGVSRAPLEDPEQGLNQNLIAESAARAAYAITTGRPPETIGDDGWFLFSDDFLNRIAGSDARILLEISTHDSIPPMEQLELANELEARMELEGKAANLHVDLLVRSGHRPREITGATFNFALTEYTWINLQRVLGGLPPVSVPGPRGYYRVDRDGVFDPDEGWIYTWEPFQPAEHPFTAEFPSFCTREPGLNRFPVVFVGEPGTSFELRVTPLEGQDIEDIVIAGTIPVTLAQAYVHDVEIASDMPLGLYGYTLAVVRPGGEPLDIDPDQTITGEPARLIVLDRLAFPEGEPIENPSVDDVLEVYRAYTPGLPGLEKTSYGLSEF